MKLIIDTKRLQILDPAEALAVVKTHLKEQGNIYYAELDGTRIVSNGNARARDRAADAVRATDRQHVLDLNNNRDAEQPALSGSATVPQISYIRSLADRDPGMGSTLGVGPMCPGWADSLTKQQASDIIDAFKSEGH